VSLGNRRLETIRANRAAFDEINFSAKYSGKPLETLLNRVILKMYQRIVRYRIGERESKAREMQWQEER